MAHQQRTADIAVDRVTQIATHSSAGIRFGSGYLVAPSWVLTAAHVADNGRVEVRLGIGTRPIARHWAVESWVGDSNNCDLALVRIPTRHPVRPVTYGRIGDHDNTVPCSMVGFPAFAFRRSSDQSDDRHNFRDSKHVHGRIHPLSNRREHTLDISISAAPPVTSDPSSPWAGMSGAAVFSSGHLVAVVSRHHHSDGPGRLAATHITDWYQPAVASDLTWIQDVTGLPADDSDLTDVGDLSQLEHITTVRAGIAAARCGDYRQAINLLGSCPPTSGEPVLTSDTHYYLALAMLGGARPRTRAWSRIQDVERHLSAAVHAQPHSPHAYALWAIVKEDYYEANGLSLTMPSIAELITRAETISSERAIEIVRHIPAPECRTWRSLSNRFQFHAENQ